MFITEQEEESTRLDYKAADSLSLTDQKKREITKDVSAMANSAGGLIIYGIAENPVARHLPDKIDPVNRATCSKETLERIISNIRPKIDDLTIHAVPIGGSMDQVVYVVEVPQGRTAHQATDLKYYKRYNFESVAMEDHEIRDVMGRMKHANVSAKLVLTREIVEVRPDPLLYFGSEAPQAYEKPECKLWVRAHNISMVLAQYIHVEISYPSAMKYNYRLRDIQGDNFELLSLDLSHRSNINYDNTVRDFVALRTIGGSGEYGPARYMPLLPGESRELEAFEVEPSIFDAPWQGQMLSWTLFADNAPARSGEVCIEDLISSVEHL